MKRLPLGPLYYEFSHHNEPRLRIEPGETVLVEAEDAFSGQIRTDADRRDKTKNPYGNPQTGPIWIEGAEPGDALAIKIEEIRPSIGPVCGLLAKGLNPDDGGAEIVCHEPGGGGAVFSVGSISYPCAVLVDDAISKITGNVLKRFLE